METDFSKQIKRYLQVNGTSSDWRIARSLYPDFDSNRRSNGARIANIRKACYRDPDILQLKDGSNYCLTANYLANNSN